VKQYLLRYDAAGDAPVMLVVHGGPGFPVSNLGYKLKRQWGDLFTLVFWDQRGCGKTLSASGYPGPYTITFEDIMSDMRAVVEHLKKSLGIQKITLLGQSWGTVLGAAYSHSHPEDLSMYIGMVPVARMDESFQVSYDRLVEVVKASGDTKGARMIESWGGAPKMGLDLKGEDLKRMLEFNKLRAKHKLVMSLTPRLVLDYVRSPVFKPSDFSFLTKKAGSLNKSLIDFLSALDMERDYPLKYEIPVCFILGDRDYQAPWTLAAKMFEKIEAPVKCLKVIKDAGHNAIYDQPEEFAKALREIRNLI
jgi:pimeloyl-ACP methyl ester carboxylesterase